MKKKEVKKEKEIKEETKEKKFEVKVLLEDSVEVNDVSKFDIRRVFSKNKNYLVIQNMYRTHSSSEDWKYGKGIWIKEEDDIALDVVQKALELLNKKIKTSKGEKK